MGKILQDDDVIDQDFSKKFSYMIEQTTIQAILSFINLQSIYWFHRRYYKTKKYLKRFVHKLIIDKIKIFEESYKSNQKKNANDDDDKVLYQQKAPTIFIEHAIQMYREQKISWNDIIAESNTIVAASFETFGNALFATLVMLAMHAEVQEKLYAEIMQLFPQKDFQLNFEDLQQLPYMEMVINETLRLTPLVPIIGRQCCKDTQVTEDLLLPKDLQIIISIFHLHRRTDIWGPQANAFNPDNFLPENISNKHPYAFIPFSKGARNCIGWRYAIFALKVFLSGLVRNYQFSTSFKFEDLQFVENIALKFLVEPTIAINRRL